MPAFEGTLSDAQINGLIEAVFDAETASGAVKPRPPETGTTLDYALRIEVVAEGLDIPWAIAFPDADTALITERGGRLRVLDKNGLRDEPVAGVPEVVHEGQGGLLDVAVDPDYANSGWVYLAYSHARPDESSRRPPAMTRVVRGRIRDHRWQDQETVYEAPRDLYLETRHHYGCRIVFDSVGRLYFSIGDRGAASQAQDASRPNGKIHRVWPNGAIPSDNPLSRRSWRAADLVHLGQPKPSGDWPSIRSPERFGKASTAPWAATNSIGCARAAITVGPWVTYGRNYNGAKVSDSVERPGMEIPALYWKPSIAVCGIDFVRGDLFPRWRNKLLVGALKYEEIRLLDIAADRVTHQEILLKNVGRIRDVACGPDGAVYAVVNGPDMVLRASPLRDRNETLD